jgi:hypothetical protein
MLGVKGLTRPFTVIVKVELAGIVLLATKLIVRANIFNEHPEEVTLIVLMLTEQVTTVALLMSELS